MKVSRKTLDALYRNIHEAIVDLRMELKDCGLTAGMDYKIAQVEHVIWRRQKATLRAENPKGWVPGRSVAYATCTRDTARTTRNGATASRWWNTKGARTSRSKTRRS